MTKFISQAELLDLVFSKEGLLGRHLKDFEERFGQKEMAEQILKAYEHENVALIEAGTGIGKSLAYLVPAVFWAIKHQTKTVISTNTIALQEQLMQKDIPFLLKTLGLDLKATLVKGMSNYLCLRKLSELQEQPLLISTDENQEINAIEKWADKTKEGSRSDLSFTVAPGTWEKVSAEGLTCSHVQCPHYKKCFFFQARKEAEDAQILIVNHHLLMADLQQRRKNVKADSIIPPYQRLVIDEAHNLEDVALSSFAGYVDRLSLLRLLSRLYSELHPEKSRLMLLKKEIISLPSIPAQLQQKLEIALPAQKRQVVESVDRAFAEGVHFMDAFAEQRYGPKTSEKLRLTDAHLQHSLWSENFTPALTALSDELEKLAIALQALVGDLEAYKETPHYERLSGHALELNALAERFQEAGNAFEKFCGDEPKEKRVRWMEKNGINMSLVDATLDVSTLLNEHLFSNKQTSVLCSATMSTSRSFSFVKQRLGLYDFQETMSENIFDSPFNYAERSLLAVPTDLPEPSHPDFLAASCKVIEEAIAISKGSVFVLFTSYEMLQSAYRILSATTLFQRYTFLKQGDLPRHLLLDQFKQKIGSVLFATDSFWEGVDVPGEALRCVIIAKLPFAVPSDPLYQAYTEALQKEGKDPFFDFSVPQAVLKFKQGFGRLMRQKNDRGCVICLDNRLVKKNYGKLFVKSLPSCATCFDTQDRIYTQMRSFYARTGGIR